MYWPTCFQMKRLCMKFWGQRIYWKQSWQDFINFKKNGILKILVWFIECLYKQVWCLKVSNQRYTEMMQSSRFPCECIWIFLLWWYILEVQYNTGNDISLLFSDCINELALCQAHREPKWNPPPPTTRSDMMWSPFSSKSILFLHLMVFILFLRLIGLTVSLIFLLLQTFG